MQNSRKHGQPFVGVYAGVVEGGKEFKPVFFTRQPPRLAAAQVIHQRLVVVVGDDAYVYYAAIDHVGQYEVDKTVSARKGYGCHAAHAGKLAHFVRCPSPSE